MAKRYLSTVLFTLMATNLAWSQEQPRAMPHPQEAQAFAGMSPQERALLMQGRAYRQGMANTLQTSLTISRNFDENRSEEEQQEELLLALYRMAARSCELALSELVETCDVVSLNNNIRIDNSDPRGIESSRAQRINATSQINLAVTFKKTGGGQTDSE